MKITKINDYGTMLFREDGSCHIENWSIATDDQSRTPVDADELALMLFEFLATQTRERLLARANATLSTMAN